MKVKRYYTGVGSRSTPVEVLLEIEKISIHLESLGFTLRSGAANGADKAFAKKVLDKEEYLPWRGFNDSESTRFEIEKEAYLIASTIHPAWGRCSMPAKKLHARNVYQILGYDLNTPSEFLICYTEDGNIKGGTATAINLALKNNIPVFNLGKPNGIAEAWEYINELKRK